MVEKALVRSWDAGLCYVTHTKTLANPLFIWSVDNIRHLILTFQSPRAVGEALDILGRRPVQLFHHTKTAIGMRKVWHKPCLRHRGVFLPFQSLDSLVLAPPESHDSPVLSLPGSHLYTTITLRKFFKIWNPPRVTLIGPEGADWWKKNEIFSWNCPFKTLKDSKNEREMLKFFQMSSFMCAQPIHWYHFQANICNLEGRYLWQINLSLVIHTVISGVG